MIKRFVIAFILLAVVAGGLVWFNFFRDQVIKDFFANMPVAPATVSTTTVEPTTWTPVIDTIGTVNAAQGVDLAVADQRGRAEHPVQRQPAGDGGRDPGAARRCRRAGRPRRREDPAGPRPAEARARDRARQARGRHQGRPRRSAGRRLGLGGAGRQARGAAPPEDAARALHRHHRHPAHRQRAST